MKNNSIVFFLLVSFFSYSQIKNGIITYGVVKSETEKFSDNEFLNKSEREASEIAKLLTATLSFNKKEASFFLNDIVLPANKDLGLYTTLLDIQNKIYENRENKIFRKYVSNSRIGDVVKKDTLQYDWAITNETKEINGYTCYKATTLRYGDGGVMDAKYAINAWFTPKIPVPYGPNGYGKLPGLILELQTYMSTVFVKTIDLNLKKDPKIDKLENYPQLTGDEIYEYMMSSLTPEQKKTVLDSKRIKN